MKPARAPQSATNVPVRVEFQVQFSGGPKGIRRDRGATSAASPEQEPPTTSECSPTLEPVEKVSLSHVPKITQLLVLGHHFENLVREGVVKDYAEIARVTGLSRARVTQITNLTLLMPEMQDAILNWPFVLDGPGLLTERALRRYARELSWQRQKRVLSSLGLNPTD